MFDEHPAIFNLRQALWALRGERMRFLAGSSKDRRDAKATDVGNAAAFLMGVCRRFGIECPTVHEVVKSPYWEISHIDNRDALDEELERIASALPKRKKAATAKQPKGGGGAELVLDEIDAKILKALAGYKHAVKLVDLSMSAGADRHVCAERINQLIRHGYAARKSQRSGAAITDKGRAYLSPAKPS